MTPISPFSPLKLLRHAKDVEDMLAGRPTTPISVELDLSNTCPHDCPWCSFGTSASQGYRQKNWVQFPTERALDLLTELAEAGVKSVTFTGGGEPLVHRAAPTLFQKASEVGLQFGVVTNGWGLRGPVIGILAARATFVRVSLDAGSPETHMRTHGVSKPQYYQILDQMLHLRFKAGWTRLTLGASFCVQSSNWREIYAAARDVKEHGANYLEVRPVYPTDWRGDGWGTSLTEDEVEQAKHEIAHARTHLEDDTFKVLGMVERFDQLHAPQKDYAKCKIGPLMTVIGADQNLWHCCVQRGQEFFKLSSVKTQSFAQAWEEANKRRMADEIDVSKCPRCRYDSYNLLIARAFQKDGMHADFL